MRLSLVLSVIFFFAFPQNAKRQTVSSQDKSDWWSILNENSSESNVKPKNEELAISNFQIAGITPKGKSFDKFAAILGEPVVVQRGDGSSGREQACYVSAVNSERVHFIAEYGELAEVFYLFEDGPDWNGSQFCTKSKRVSKELSTDSGLKLGLSKVDVEKILGKPDATLADRILYFREVEKRATAAEFEKMRKNYPRLTDEEAHKQFDLYTCDLYVEVRFLNSKLSYLAVSRIEAY